MKGYLGRGFGIDIISRGAHSRPKRIYPLRAICNSKEPSLEQLPISINNHLDKLPI